MRPLICHQHLTPLKCPNTLDTQSDILWQEHNLLHSLSIPVKPLKCRKLTVHFGISPQSGWYIQNKDMPIQHPKESDTILENFDVSYQLQVVQSTYDEFVYLFS